MSRDFSDEPRGTENLLEEWVKWSFDQYSGGNPFLTRRQMKLAVISLTGGRPKGLPRGQTSFSLAELYQYIYRLNSGTILGDVSSLYDQFDCSGHGFVTLQDLLAAAEKNNANFSQKVLEDAFNRVDTDQDGRISYRDFLNTVKTGLIELGVFSR
jgi:hypothetical protein